MAPARVVSLIGRGARHKEMEDEKGSHATEEYAPCQALIPERCALLKTKEHTTCVDVVCCGNEDLSIDRMTRPLLARRSHSGTL